MNHLRILIACSVGLYVAAPMMPAARAGQVAWHTGAALDETLQRPLGISLTGAPLSGALAKISRTQRIAIVLDRRVDPQQTITLEVTDEPLQDVLAEIAQHVDAGYCQFGPVAYIGPPHTAKTLRTLAALRLDDVRPLPPAQARRLLRAVSSQWEDLAEPRALVSGLAEEAGVQLVGADLIPHDLWRAADLPPMSWIDRLTLLAAQFDLTFRLDQAGKQARLVPIPQRVAIARDYQAPRRADVLARQWSRALPAARVTAGDNRVRLEGLIEDHEFVERRLRGTPTRRTKVARGKQVYQFNAENAALEQVVEQVAARLQLEAQWDRAAIQRAGIATEQLITVHVKDATLDELLRAIFKDTGLTFRQTGRTLSIRPDDSKPRAAG